MEATWREVVEGGRVIVVLELEGGSSGELNRPD